MAISARGIGASTTFESGARTAWYTHPLSQTLIVLSGLGFAPGGNHWHGASPTTAMTHIAVQETLNGKVVDWKEQVSDAQYEGKGG